MIKLSFSVVAICESVFFKFFNLSSQKRISFEPTTTYLLKELKPFTTYTFRLAARSKHGVGAYTSEISAETPQTRRSSSIYDPVKKKKNWKMIFKCI